MGTLSLWEVEKWKAIAKAVGLSASINANSDAFETVFGLAFVARLIDS